MIERNIIEKLGTRFINGKELSIKELIDNGTDIAKKNALTIGQGLTKEQIAKLDKDIVWYEYQNVDGIQVLAPKVYLSQNTLKNLNSDSRTKIVGLDNTYIKTNKLENTALISGRGNTFIEADEVNNRTLGNQLAEISGENTQIIATNNINNIGARISAKQNLNLIAVNGDILNKSTVEKVEFNNGEFDRSKFTKIASVGEIISDGNLNIIANNYTSEGAVTQAKNVNINVTNDVNISSQKVSGEQKFGKNDGQYNYYGFERNLGSVVKTENLNVTAKNVNISGSVVTTQTADLNVDKLNIESKVDKEDEIKKSSYKSFLKSGSKKEIIHNEENSAGSLYVENKGTIKGDVNLVGSNLVLGDNSIINGKLTTDSNELHSSYSLEEKKKGFSSSIGSGGFSVGYGKSQSKLKEKDLTNAKSNLVLGDNVTLNKGAEITATNFTHGKVTVNNGDVKFGARKDTRDVETSSKSSGVNLSVRIKSEALDRAKQGVDSVNQLKSGDILGGLASTTNTVTGLVQGLSSNITKKDGSKATLKDIKDGDFKVNNNFYANAGVNLGFNKSSSKSNSHSESAVVTTIRGKDENSSITYNNVKNVEYVGTQAKDTKFIYNNVENINKTAVELNNSHSSTGKSSGISTGVTIGYGDGTQTEFNGVSISASKSNMNSNGTTYQNGRFVNVDEVHNNTKNMTLSGFNQEGGTVTGNIENLTIESKQNTSTTKGSTKGGSLSVSANGLPSGSANYSKTNGERKVVDNASTFIIGDGSNLKVGKLENTASAIGTTENGKLSIDEYVGHNLENVDKLKTAGGSVGVSTSGITSIGVNYSDKKQEGITKNTVIGNVEIGKSSGDEINRDLDTMTEITEDRDFKTNINVESQTISYIKNPEKFKEDLQIAIIEGKATGRTVVKTIDNVINGDKSQDIGDAERRSLIEIKEAIVRVQTAPAMDIIAEKDLADKNIQARLGVEIEKFDPNDPTLSEKVRERIDELKAEGKELVAFYDKVTKKIFINQNAKDEEVRASIAREYKIKEDLELGRGKENDKGQLRSTVAGEIAYDEIKDRLKKGDKNPISASSFDVAKMDKDSEVTADNYRFEDRKLRKEYKEIVYFTDERKEQMSEGGLDMMAGGGTALAGGAVIGASIGVDYVSFGTTIVPSTAAKAGGATAVVVGGNRFITGGLKFLNGLYGSGKKETLNPIRDSIPKKYQGYYDAFEVTVEVGILHLAPHAQPYYSQPNKSVINISQQQRELNKQMNLNASVGQQKVPISSTRSSTDGKNYNAIKEISQGKVFINNEKTGETTMAYQKRITYSNGSMRIFQENLTTGEISLQKINPLGQRVFEKTLTPYKSNTLIEASSSSKMLVGDRAVSQVASKVGQVQNNRLPYKPVLALPVKYPIVTKSGVTLYQDYAIGSRGAKYIEVGVSNNKEIVYKNNSGSYFKLTDKGLENISSKDVIKKEYFPTVKVQKNNGSNPSAGKNYYVSKEGNFKVEKYIEAGQTVEDYDKIYLIENVRARGINVGRSKEHTNTTISHWEKAVDIADEAKVDPNVKAVYVDETLKNISDKFKDSDARPDVTIEYKDGTFKLIEVQSKTDYRPKLENKLKNLQTKYGEDVITNYKVEKPKGGK